MRVLPKFLPWLPTKIWVYQTFLNVRLRLDRSLNTNETERYRTNIWPEGYLNFSLKDT